MKPVLLLVDLQRDYLAAAELQPSAGAITEAARLLLEACRSRNIPVAHLWTTVSPQGPDQRMPHWQAQERWICVEGRAGHQPPAELQPADGEKVLHKTGFSPFTSPSLAEFLEAGGYDAAIVAGIHLHACVRETVLGAYERGLRVWVAEEACGSDDPLHAAITRRYLQVRAARFVSTAQLFHELDSPSPPPVPGTPSTKEIEVPRSATRGLVEVPMLERIQALRDFAEWLEAEAAPLALQMADAIGKPVYYGQGEIRRTADMIRTVIARSQTDRRTNHGDQDGVRHQAIGGVAVITPWNNPYFIPLGKIAPALLYGNTVAWKPAPLTWGIACNIHAWLKARVPNLSAILTLVDGGRDVAEQLMKHPDIQAVTLTGSLETGYSAQEICARRHLPYQAELGGNNAAIVWNDADMRHAAELIAEGAFALAGQRCTANRRVIVQASWKREFLTHLTRVTGALPWGDPRETETRIGPLASPAHRARVAAVVERAQARGHRVWSPPGLKADPATWGHDGAWHPPVIIECDDPQDELVQHETFGPVLVVQTATTWNEALDLLNGVPQGLAAALFSSSEELVQDFLAEARAGILKVNQATADAALDMPFGGWKASGSGPPEHGRFDREFFTRPQTIYTAPSGKAP